MKKRTILHITYWMIVLLFLTLFFGHNWESYILAFYFSTFLLPIVIGTSYFFNWWLVPRSLLTGRYWHFALYFFYMLVVSLYAELLVALLSFILIANYKIEVMGLESISIFFLGATLYLIVFVTSFIRIILLLREKSRIVNSLQKEIKKKQKNTLLIRSNRKNNHIPLDELLYIESMNDYVKIITTRSQLTAREKITKLHTRLPAQFVRIHRSFLVNKDLIQSFSKSEVIVGGTTLPIGRTYKKSTLEILEDRDP